MPPIKKRLVFKDKQVNLKKKWISEEKQGNVKKRRKNRYPPLKPKISVVKLPFKVLEVEQLPGYDSSVGGINKFAAVGPKYKIPYPFGSAIVLVDSELSDEAKEKTIKHEKAEATIMATLRNLKRKRINNIDYGSAHLLTNRLDYIYGNTFSYTKKGRKRG